jgi:hypothetical protein
LGSTARRSPLRSVGGSIRRKISFRDMNSMKRQPSLIRNGKSMSLRSIGFQRVGAGGQFCEIRFDILQC